MFSSMWRKLKTGVLKIKERIHYALVIPKTPPPTYARASSYFEMAQSWADDYLTSAEVSKNRWKAVALYILIPLCFLLLLCVVMLIPAQHLEPLLIHHYENGVVSVERLHQPYAPKNQAEVESDLVRYIQNRESYSAASYHDQYQLATILSSPQVLHEYMSLQSSTNRESPVNLLGSEATRSVHIESILFLDNLSENKGRSIQQPHQNLAQIDFTITDHDRMNETLKMRSYTALISWDYRQASLNPEERWRNWNGFTVTHYRVQPRNMHS